MRKLGALALAAVVAAGCGGSSAGSLATSSAPSPSAAGAAVLPVGKELMTLEARTYRSPDGFVPAVTVDVPAGWSSVHRYDDAFDVTQPDPTRDAPAVAVIWMTPDAPTAGAALVKLKGVAGAKAATGRIGATPALGMDIPDGSGPLLESARQGIAIDAAKGQRVRVLGADIGGKPLLVVILVPDAASWDALLAKALPLVESVTPV